MGSDQIRLIQTADMLCEDAAIATIAAWWGLHYEMAYSELWDFDFVKANDELPQQIGNRICIKNEKIKFQLLKEYHNIALALFDCADPNEKTRLVLSEIKNNHPVVTFFKIAQKPWIKPYDISDGSDPLILFEFDKGNNGFHCIDIHGEAEKIEFLSLEVFLKGCVSGFSNDFYSFAKLKPVNNPVDWRAIVKSAVNSMQHRKTLSKNAFDAIRLFADSMEFMNILTECPNEKIINNTPLCSNLRKICRYRNLFASSLEYMSQKCDVPPLSEIAKMFLQCGSKWYLVLSLIAKIFYKHAIDLSRISKIKQHVYQIADFEESIADLLLNTVETYRTADRPKFDRENIEQGFTDTSYIFLDLKEYFNSKAFNADPQNVNKVDFTGTNNCFLTDGLPADGILYAEGISFSIKECSTNNDDNIACDSQIINIPKEIGVAESISFLCCGEWGNFYESVKLYFANGNIESTYLEFTDWIYVTPPAGWSVAWKGTTLNFKDSENIRLSGAYLYMKKFRINSKSEILSIELPNSPSSHIFAISLGKNEK